MVNQLAFRPTLAFRHFMHRLVAFKVGNKYIIVVSGLLPTSRGVEVGEGESTRAEEGDLEATRLSGRRPKVEARGVTGRRPKIETSRVEVANMEETTYSTILPLNSTLLSVEHDLHRPPFVPGSVPAPPPPPPQSCIEILIKLINLI